LAGIAAPVHAGDNLSILPDVHMPSVDMNVDVDIGPPRPRPFYPARGPYARMIAPVRLPGPPPDLHPVLAPSEVVVILRATGYSPLGPLVRRGWVYTISAIDPRGDDGRLIIDARTGRIMRFIPAYAVSDNLNEQLNLVYGPPGPPPVADLMPHASTPYASRLLPPGAVPSNPPAPLPKVGSRTSPAAPLPKVAARAPSSAPIAASAPVSTRHGDKLAVQGGQQTASAQGKPAVATPPETKPLEAKPELGPPAEVKPATEDLQPTRDMPPVQGLE
jgi:hypothetical protein